MTGAERFPFPAPAGQSPVRWSGEAFVSDSGTQRILAYGAAASGWTDHLTSLHEGAAGDDHFIDLASRAAAIQEIVRTTPSAGAVVLEVGISSGFLVNAIVKALPAATVLGSDYTYNTLVSAAERLPASVPLLQFDLTACPLPDASVDTVVLLNVLEHIERDELAMSHLHRILKPGGRAIIEVPAGPGLFDSYDRALMHFRRYSMTALTSLARGAGFHVERRSHLGFFLYPGFYAAKKFGRANAAPTAQLDARVEKSISWSRRLGAVAASSLTIEAAVRPRLYVPFGIRCLLTARKEMSA